MHFNISQSAFNQLLQTVSKAVATRTPKQVLTGILLNVEETTLHATAYDLEIGIEDSLDVTPDGTLEIISPGSIVIPARYLTDVVRKLPSTLLTFQVSNPYMADIRSGTAEFHLHGIDAAEFPKLPIFHSAKSLTISSLLLRQFIRSSAYAASTLEARPTLTGIHSTLHMGQMTFTATDGLRLGMFSENIPENPDFSWDAVIPAKSLTELTKLLPEQDMPVTLELSNSHSLFVIGKTHFYTRLIEGAYPDISRIIPNHFGTTVRVDTAQFANAIDRAALIARDKENHMVRMELQDRKITISSNSPEIGNVSESIETIETVGDDLVIAFNSHYVLEALRATGSDQVQVQFNGSNQPFTLHIPEEQNNLQLISPVLMR
ncbi:DNA polymerase III subunit beta [Alicyclobacillaceae bacterium I2511]|nr:DNA polymerase III subunit beta [Alicyclobacillaceae bacterium I2511]